MYQVLSCDIVSPVDNNNNQRNLTDPLYLGQSHRVNMKSIFNMFAYSEGYIFLIELQF